PDGGRIFSGSQDDTIRVWNPVSAGKPVGPALRGPDRAVHTVAVSPDGRLIAVASGEPVVRLFDAVTRQPVGRPLQGHTRAVSSVAFSPDGRRMVTGSGDMTLRLWDTTT